MNQDGSIALDHYYPNGFGKVRRQPTDIVDGATGNYYSHGLGNGGIDLAARTVSTMLRMITVAS